MINEPVDVLIVGAGASGAAIAYYLSSLGVKILCLEQGVATKESIDEIMTLGMAHPMGPLRLADLIGLDICLDIMNVLFDGFEDEKYKPSELLENMVKKGNLGRKSGKGFYNY